MPKTSGAWVSFPGGSMYMDNTDEVFTDPAGFVARLQAQRAQVQKEYKAMARVAKLAEKSDLPAGDALVVTARLSIPVARKDEALKILDSDIDPETMVELLRELEDKPADNSK